MTTREWLPLIGLTVSAFLVNTSEFIPVGLLTDIAKSLGVTEAKAGILITGYSWTVTLLSLPLMLVFSRMRPRKLLLLTLFVFSLGQFLSVIAPGYAFLMIARICVASSHCIFWSIASPLAVRVVSRKHRSLALSAIVTGTSIAMVAGMPLGRLIGLQIGWRMTFMCVASVAVLTLVYLTAVFPDLSSGAAFSVKNMPELLRNRRLMLIYVICALWATAYYTGYGYIEPFLRRVANLPDGTVTIVLMLFGGAGLVGSMLFYRFYDFHRHAFLCSTLALISAALLLLRVSSFRCSDRDRRLHRLGHCRSGLQRVLSVRSHQLRQDVGCLGRNGGLLVRHQPWHRCRHPVRRHRLHECGNRKHRLCWIVLQRGGPHHLLLLSLGVRAW